MRTVVVEVPVPIRDGVLVSSQAGRATATAMINATRRELMLGSPAAAAKYLRGHAGFSDEHTPIAGRDSCFLNRVVELLTVPAPDRIRGPAARQCAPPLAPPISSLPGSDRSQGDFSRFNC
jgi:hypothetical protein